MAYLLGLYLPIIILLIVLFVIKVRNHETKQPYRPPFYRKQPQYPDDLSDDRSGEIPPGWFFPPYFLSRTEEEDRELD